MIHIRKRAFTLIELLVVIAIIGVLASIVLVSLQTARAKGRDARRIADIKNIQLALEEYYNDNLKYPPSLYASALAPTYIVAIPIDPQGASGPGYQGSHSGNYPYTALNAAGSGVTTCISNTRYHLGAALEISASAGTGNYSSNPDTAADSSDACSTSAPSTDFNGLSLGCTVPTAANGGAIDSCYDVANQ